MPFSELVKIGRRQPQELHEGFGHDVGGSRFVGDETHLPRDVAGTKFADRRPILWRIAHACATRARSE